MTTLPQTTTVRVPRTTGPSSLMVPGMGLPPGQVQGMGSQMSGTDVWRVIRANAMLILVTVVAFTILGVGVYFWLGKYYPRYTAVGLIEVQPVIIDPLAAQQAGVDRSYIELEQRTQAQQMRHDSLLSSVLTRSQALRGTGWFAQFNNNVSAAKEDLLDRLTITPVIDTKLIMVSVSYSDPRDAKVMAEELVDQFLRQQSDTRRDAQLRRSQTLNEMQRNQQVRLNELNEELRQRGSKLAVDAMGVPGHLTAKDSEASQLVLKLVEQDSKLEAAKSSYEKASAQLAAGQDPSDVDELVARDSMLNSYRQALDSVDIQISEAVKLGKDHPLVKQLNARREAYLKKYDDLRAEQAAKYRAAYIDRLKSTMAIEQLGVDRLNKQVEEVRADLAGLTGDLNIYLSKLDEQKTVRDNLANIKKALDDITAYQGRMDQAGVFWSQKPDVPDSRSFPKLSITLALAVMLGLALSVGLAFLREMLDTSVRSPRDIARIGQLNLLGIVQDEQDDPQVAGVRLPLAIFEAPQSIVAEQLRQIRTRLQHSVSLDTTRAILVTSAGPEDGKTTIACNLAAGLALNGRRILLVDGNFRRPQLHNVFGIDNEKVFANALATPDEFALYAKPTTIPNLTIMPCGPKPPNATELLESQLLIDFIDRVLDEYDQIIFDSGPLLFVSESVALAPRVDGVVTVVRAAQNSRGALQRVRDTLRQIKAQQVGVVLNAVKVQGGGYYAQNIRTYYEYQNLPTKV